MSKIRKVQISEGVKERGIKEKPPKQVASSEGKPKFPPPSLEPKKDLSD